MSLRWRPRESLTVDARDLVVSVARPGDAERIGRGELEAQRAIDRIGLFAERGESQVEVVVIGVVAVQERVGRRLAVENQRRRDGAPRRETAGHDHELLGKVVGDGAHAESDRLAVAQHRALEAREQRVVRDQHVVARFVDQSEAGILGVGHLGTLYPELDHFLEQPNRARGVDVEEHPDAELVLDRCRLQRAGLRLAHLDHARATDPEPGVAVHRGRRERAFEAAPLRRPTQGEVRRGEGGLRADRDRALETEAVAHLEDRRPRAVHGEGRPLRRELDQQLAPLADALDVLRRQHRPGDLAGVGVEAEDLQRQGGRTRDLRQPDARREPTRGCGSGSARVPARRRSRARCRCRDRCRWDRRSRTVPCSRPNRPRPSGSRSPPGLTCCQVPATSRKIACPA